MQSEPKEAMKSNSSGEREDTVPKRRGAWSAEEHQRYLKAMQLFEAQTYLIPEKWKFIQGIVKTRSVQQCRSHHQKYELKVRQLESKRQRQQQHYYETNEGSQGMQPPQNYQVESYYHGPRSYPPVYTPHFFGQQEQTHQYEQVMTRPHNQQPRPPPQYWLQIPPPPPPQYQYYSSPPPLPYQQQAQFFNTPNFTPPTDSSSAPPRSNNNHK